MKKKKEIPIWMLIPGWFLVGFGLVFVLLAFFGMIIYVKVFNRYVLNYFKNHPHLWLTENELVARTGKSDVSVFISLMVLDTLGFLEHRLSQKLIDEADDLSPRWLARIKNSEAAGEPTSLNRFYYEYRLRKETGTKLPSFTFLLGRLNTRA